MADGRERIGSSRSQARYETTTIKRPILEQDSEREQRPTQDGTTSPLRVELPGDDFGESDRARRQWQGKGRWDSAVVHLILVCLHVYTIPAADAFIFRPSRISGYFHPMRPIRWRRMPEACAETERQSTYSGKLGKTREDLHTRGSLRHRAAKDKHSLLFSFNSSFRTASLPFMGSVLLHGSFFARSLCAPIFPAPIPLTHIPLPPTSKTERSASIPQLNERYSP